jgi:chromosome partitioning protein
MFTILIASPKAASGKTMLATNVAGMLSARKQRVAIMDLDKRGASTQWIGVRPNALPKIIALGSSTDHAVADAFRPRWLVIDTHARLSRDDRNNLLERANVVLVPVNGSVYDIEASAKLLIKLHQDPNVRSGRVAVGVVGSRVDARTRIARELTNFFKRTGVEVVAYIPDSVHYAQCARVGLSIFDLPSARTTEQLAAWQPLVDWLKTRVAAAKASKR